MSQSTPPLQEHLLTRSDLARMAVPAAEVLAWLASGALEQVGTLPPEDERGEPVFTVSTPELQRELTTRLGRIGKSAVVLTPLHVRSFLIRTMLRAQPAAPVNGDDAIADGTELQRVLLDAAHEVLADIEVMQHLAAEEAQLEAAELVRQQQEATALANAELADPVEPADEEAGMDGDVFDFDDLAQALDHLDGTPSMPTAATPPAEAAAEAGSPAPTTDTQPEAPNAVAGAGGAHAPPPDANQDRSEAVTDGEAMNEAESAAEDLSATMPGEATADPVVVTAEEALAIAGEAGAAVEAAAAQPAAAPATTTTATTAASVGEPDSPAPHAMPAEIAPAAAVAAPIADAELLQAAVQAAANEATEQSMQRVESFLGQLKDALVQMANRPATPSPEFSSLVTTVQSALERTQQQAASQQAALQTLGDKLSDFGQRVENGVTHGVAAVLERAHAPAAQPAAVEIPRYVVHRGDRSSAALIAVMVLVLCWSLLFWFKTESLRLAVSTLIGANVIGCCLLVARRHSSDG
ncbi:MAG: hypothetical protein K8J09_21345 [Planctomycetes bacterium]|nr:hypothetical protein [Planctomycetota bacterium]MCC7397453.1 hypothetical protein [Planctomycetota bacterium]